MTETVYDNYEDALFEFIFYNRLNLIRVKKPRFDENDRTIQYYFPSEKGIIIKTVFVEEDGRKFPNKTYYDYNPLTFHDGIENLDKKKITAELKNHLIEYIKNNNSVNDYFTLIEKGMIKKNNAVKYEIKFSDYVSFNLQIEPTDLDVEDVSSFIISLPVEQLNQKKSDNSKSEADSSDPWKVELAKSSRAACRGCSDKIQKGKIRIGQPSYYEGHISYKWYHLDCVKGFNDSFELIGLEDLKDEEQMEVKNRLFTSKSQTKKSPKELLSDIILEFENSDGLTAESDVYKKAKELNMNNDEIKSILTEMEEEGLFYRPDQGKIKFI